MRGLGHSLVVVLLVLALGCSSEALSGGGQGEGSESGGATNGGFGPRPFGFADYPDAPYGTKAGSMIDNFAFLGWHAPKGAGYDTNALETVELADFYNPGGTRNDVKLLVINASAVWCAVCRAEYRHIREQGIYADYRARGVELFGTLFEDLNYEPAKPQDLRAWGESAEHQVEFPLGLDPSFKLGIFFSSDATPMNLIVDARTMTILDVTMGYSTAYWQQIDATLEQL